jgi:hypothetical protein
LEKRVVRAVSESDLPVDAVDANSRCAVAREELGLVMQGGNSRSYLILRWSFAWEELQLVLQASVMQVLATVAVAVVEVRQKRNSFAVKGGILWTALSLVSSRDNVIEMWCLDYVVNLTVNTWFATVVQYHQRQREPDVHDWFELSEELASHASEFYSSSNLMPRRSFAWEELRLMLQASVAAVAVRQKKNSFAVVEVVEEAEEMLAPTMAVSVLISHL